MHDDSFPPPDDRLPHIPREERAALSLLQDMFEASSRMAHYYQTMALAAHQVVVTEGKCVFNPAQPAEVRARAEELYQGAITNVQGMGGLADRYVGIAWKCGQTLALLKAANNDDDIPEMGGGFQQ